MKRIDVRMVTALVVARARELRQYPVMTLGLWGGMTALGVLQVVIQTTGRGTAAMSAFNAALLGTIVVNFANPRHRMSQLGGIATVEGSVGPALPVSGWERNVAIGALAFAMTSPFVLSVLLLWLARFQTAEWVAVTLGGLLFGAAAYALIRGIGRRRALISIAAPSAWFATLHPARGTETSVAFWVLVPGIATGVLTGAITTLCMVAIFAMSMSNTSLLELGVAPPAWTLAMVMACSGSIGSIGRLMALADPLARLAVSRRALAFAHLRLLPIRLVVTGISTIAISHVIGHDPALTQAIVQVALTLACAETAACAWWTRVVGPSWGGSEKAFVMASIAYPLFGIAALAALVSVFTPVSVVTPILGGAAVLALLAAVAFAYTTPNTPLSREPTGFTSDVLRFVGVL